MPLLALIAGYIIVIFLGLIGLVIVLRIFTGKIDLQYLVSEKASVSSPASLSRFQFLIFTFVVAMCLLVLTLESGEFPQVGANVLGLLGISGGSYLVSKSIPQSKIDEVKVEQTRKVTTAGEPT